MSTTTLLEAHERFAAALDELRRKYVADFDQWLKTALTGDVGNAQREARDRIATARKLFTDEFLDQRAPALIRSFNPNAEYDILKALRTYDAKPEALVRRGAAAASPRWQASLWRTALAAAFGAVVGVIILALQPVPEVPTPPPAVTQPTQPTPQDPAAQQPNIQVPAAPAAQAPTETTPQPPPEGSLLTMKRADLVKLLLTAAFVAALGAAIGVLIMACPPIPAVLERFGLKGSMLQLVRNLGITFVILRAGPLIVLAAALLSGLFALIAWLLGGSRPLHVLVGVAAVATVLAARWTTPSAEMQERETVHRALLAQLDGELRADANVWAALSAAIVLRRDDGAGPPRDPVKTEITNIILARRANGETNEAILSVVEQRLGIPARAGSAKPTPELDSEFIWKPEHAQFYDTFGAVELNDVVIVSRQPLFIEGADGRRQVTRKGLVAPKG